MWGVRRPPPPSTPPPVSAAKALVGWSLPGPDPSHGPAGEWWGPSPLRRALSATATRRRRHCWPASSARWPGIQQPNRRGLRWDTGVWESCLFPGQANNLLCITWNDPSISGRLAGSRFSKRHVRLPANLLAFAGIFFLWNVVPDFSEAGSKFRRFLWPRGHAFFFGCCWCLFACFLVLLFSNSWTEEPTCHFPLHPPRFHRSEARDNCYAKICLAVISPDEECTETEERISRGTTWCPNLRHNWGGFRFPPPPSPVIDPEGKIGIPIIKVPSYPSPSGRWHVCDDSALLEAALSLFL